ncbi:secreted protein [Beggiatoa sp. PS]|nr:secreted protein [Beggiatoa sp. PS]
MKKILQITACFIIFALTLSVNASETVPIFYIDAKDKTATEIGTTLGKAIKKKWPTIEKKYDTYLAQVVEQKQFNEWLPKKNPFDYT